VIPQVLGVGPLDLLLFNGPGNHLELAWQVPDFHDLYNPHENGNA
jgi:hypothetical protein